MENTLKNTELIENLLSCDLSPYAKQFVLSLKSWIKNRNLTTNQMAALRRIESNYNDMTIKKGERDALWVTEWNKEKAKKAKLCAQYYIENPPYFNDLAFRILNYKDYVPTREEYDRIINNKYARRVIKEHFTPGLFKEGTLVSVRKPAIDGAPMIIIKENAAPIVNAATGAKRYMALPMGRDKPILIEERYIKKYNKNY